MWNRKLALGAAVALVALVIVPAVARGQSSAVSGGVDQTPPILTVNVKPAFVVGNILTPLPGDPGSGRPWFTGNIAQFMQWSATDDSGRICSYDLYVFGGAALANAVLDHTQDTQYTYMAGTDSYLFGGQHVTTGFQVTARDCSVNISAGNATSKVVYEKGLTVNQEDGTAESYTGSASGQFTYKGPWATTSCDCFLGGKTARTTTQGARATFTRTYDEGDHVALVMAEGPGRGVASIRIDDKWLMNIDTYAPVDTNAIVVFERMMTAGTHTVAIVNQATAGRPRIDLDAVMTN